MGPGAPFEIVVEDVLGAPAEVFAQRPRNLREVIERAGLDHGDKVFLVSPEGEEITYADAVARIARVADTLAREYGVSKGDRVGLASANTVEYILCYWATLALGAILSNFNGWWTTPELAHGIELTEPVVVLADARRLELLEKLPAPEQLDSWPPLVPMETAAAAGLTPDGPDVAMPTTPDRRGRPGHHPVHQRDDRAFQGRCQHPSQLDPLRALQHRRGRRRHGGRRRLT